MFCVVLSSQNTLLHLRPGDGLVNIGSLLLKRGKQLGELGTQIVSVERGMAGKTKTEISSKRKQKSLILASIQNF